MSLKFKIFSFLHLFILILASIEDKDKNKFLTSSNCNDTDSHCIKYFKAGYCTNISYFRIMRSNQIF